MANDGRLTKGRLPGVLLKLLGALGLGTALQVMRINNAGTGVEFGSGRNWDIILQGQFANTVSGGALTGGVPATRPLNTEVFDPDGLCSLSSNQFTLVAGTYEMEFDAYAMQTNGDQTYLYNVSDGVIVFRGMSGYSGSAYGASAYASGVGVFTIASAKVFELRTSGTTTSGHGLGYQSSQGGTEIYTTVKMKKVA